MATKLYRFLRSPLPPPPPPHRYLRFSPFLPPRPPTHYPSHINGSSLPAAAAAADTSNYDDHNVAAAFALRSYNIWTLLRPRIINDGAATVALRSFCSYTSPEHPPILQISLKPWHSSHQKLLKATLHTSGLSLEAEVETASQLAVRPFKTKKLTKTAKHIMEILDREAVESVRKDKEIPNVQPGDIVQLRVEVPENKRRVSLLKGIVIARRNSGISTTFRIRRVLAGVGVETVFPLYSPNIKEIKILEKRKVRRAKLFYLRQKIARMSSF